VDLAGAWGGRGLDPRACAQEALLTLLDKGGADGEGATIKSPKAWLRRAVRDLLVDALRERDTHRAHADGLRAYGALVARERQSDADPAAAPAGRRGSTPLSPQERWLVALHDAYQSIDEIARLTRLSVLEVTATLKCVVLRRYGPVGDGAGLPWHERVAVLTRAGLELDEIAVILRVKLACLKKRLQRRYRPRNE
jgi:DNA-directed RNA polymerase specialized sigma24 family protein